MRNKNKKKEKIGKDERENSRKRGEKNERKNKKCVLCKLIDEMVRRFKQGIGMMPRFEI
jgi:hypothetical protein